MVEYDGSSYAGWQRQLTGLAVQQVLEEALAQACGIAADKLAGAAVQAVQSRRKSFLSS